MKDDDKKSKLIDNLAKLFVHITSDSFEKATKRAVLICFALKYVLSIGIYIALRNFAGLQFSELWMVLVFAYALYGHELYINTKLKEGLVKSILREQDNEEKDTEDISCVEDTEEEKKS